MFRCRDLAAAIAAIAIVASCGTEPSSGESAQTDDASHTLPKVEAEADRSNEPVPAVSTVPDGAASNVNVGAPLTASRSQTVQLDQPAVWPASDVVFDTPEEAATSFVTTVLGVEPVLGDFAGGDSRSGEITVFSPGDTDAAAPSERGLLGLRMIGPSDGWFIIGAGSEGVLIESPDTLDRVSAGPLVVTGRGRGFEGTVVVTAFRAGDADDVLDQVITSGGAREMLEQYSVTLDLSDVEPGDVVALLVRGDTGLDGDPGEFASIPIVIGDLLPETR